MSTLRIKFNLEQKIARKMINDQMSFRDIDPCQGRFLTLGANLSFVHKFTLRMENNQKQYFPLRWMAWYY